MIKKLYTFLAAVLLTATTSAQTPEKMSYQAVVRDSGDALVTNQAVGMQISILQTTATGTAVYVETQNQTTNINGLVSLEIGTGNVISGDFTTIDWSSNTYFIKTETDPTGGSSYTITGTSQFMSVPYALYAKTSGSSIPGPTGAQGIAGNDGTNGAIGATGAQGPQGLAGNDGATGSQGIAGNDGTNGAIGATGAQGPQGLAGNDGATGAQGLAGNDGTNGAIGATGVQGPQGLAGNDGATGAQGIAGNDGTNGTNGATGAQGAQGLAGNDGATGAQGLAGNDGTNGAIGVTGAQGPQGLVGNDGATGAQGIAGNDGTNGAIGATGVQGPQGPAGNDGATGAQGIAGNDGTNGAIGATGAQGPQGPAGNDGATVAQPTYTVGLWPELGGYVFWVSPDGKHGLVAETQDQGVATWFEAQNLTSNPANHSANGAKFRDWRMPTKYELNEMYLQQVGIGSFGTYKYYWSSTQANSSGQSISSSMWNMYFTNGYQGNHLKNLTNYVRSIRAF